MSWDCPAQLTGVHTAARFRPQPSQQCSSAHFPHPAQPALGPRVPHTWSDFLERLWRLLLHLISCHHTLVKGVCGRTHGLSMLVTQDIGTQLDTEKMSSRKDLPARFSGAPSTLNTVPIREATAAGGKKQTGAQLVPGHCYLDQPCLASWGCL